MKILNEDRISGVAASSTFSTFAAANVYTDRPRQPWIGTLTDSDLVETFTASVNGSATYPIQGFFIAGLVADSCTWVLKDSGASTINSGTLNTTIPKVSDLSGNASNGNQYFKNQTHLLRSEFVVFDTPMEDTGTLVLTLTTSVNRLDQFLIGNAVAAWEAVRAETTGRFIDSSGAPINVLNHGMIQLGGFFQGTEISSPVTVNTTISVHTLGKSVFTINDTVTLTIADGATFTVTEGASGAQVNSVTGDGTAVSGVTLGSNIGSVAATSLYFSVRIGVLRCGTLLDLPNPKASNLSSIDYSLKRPHLSGGYSHQQRGVADAVSLSVILTNAQQQSLSDTLRAFRAKPMPMEWGVSLPSGFNEGERASGLYYVADNHKYNFFGSQGNRSVFNLNLVEVI